VTVKIGLKQEDEEDRIIVNELLDSGVIGLVMSLEFMRKHKFEKKLKKPIYVRNVNGIFNYERPIEHTIEVKLLLFYKGHKEQTEINIIKG